MARLTSWALATVCLVALAGCAGPTASTPGSPAGTSATTPIATPTGTDEYPPGITADGVPEPFTLAQAHAAALADSSYTVTETYEVRYANGTLYTAETETVRVAANADRYLYSSTVRGTARRFLGGSNGTLVYYSNGSTVVRKVQFGGNASYGVVLDPDGNPSSPRSASHGTPRNDELIAVRFGQASNVSVTRHNDTTYRLRTTTFADDAVDVAGIPLRNVTVDAFAATVTADGLVRAYRVKLRGTVHGHEVTVSEQVRYSAVGATDVDRPAWYDTAVENASDWPG